MKLRITHVKPGAPTKVWDAIMTDGRRDVRVFPDGLQGNASEFIEINVIQNTDGMASFYPRNLIAGASGVVPEPAPKLSKAQRKKIARRKAK